MASRQMDDGRMVTKQADAEVQGYIDQVKLKVEEAVGRSLDQYTATVYSTQHHNAYDIFVKVDVGEDQFVHVRLYKSLTQEEVTFSGCQDAKTKDDALYYF